MESGRLNPLVFDAEIVLAGVMLGAFGGIVRDLRVDVLFTETVLGAEKVMTFGCGTTTLVGLLKTVTGGLLGAVDLDTIGALGAVLFIAFNFEPGRLITDTSPYSLLYAYIKYKH